MKNGEKAYCLDGHVSDIWMDSNELKESEFHNNKMTAPEGKRTFYEIYSRIYEGEGVVQ